MSVSGASKASEVGNASHAYSLIAMPPQPFGKYTLIGKLGHGGMAEVNLAVAEGKSNFRKLVVIKRLHRHLAMEPGFVDMFLDEARLAARLNHPHCVQTYEVEEWEDNHFLAMEYLDGQGLERLLRISGQKGLDLPVELAARIVSDALDGLAYAHELTDYDGTPLGVVHRDVSPQNIFVTYAGMVKLLDFGIAKAATHVVETRTGVIKGKYAYIAPEQALAQEVDHRADLWSMGVVLWELLTGRRLFKSVNELATLHETLQGEIKLPSAFRPDLPTDLDTICMRALERDVGARYQTAQEMKEDLDRYLASLPKSVGRKHIARLMRERFEEVIDVHKQTLAQCLSGGVVPASGIQQLVDGPAVTPTGSLSRGAGPSITPTPTPSAEHVAVLAAPPSGSQSLPAQERSSGGLVWKVGLVLLVGALAGLGAFLLPLGGDEEQRASLPVATGAGDPVAGDRVAAADVTAQPVVDPVANDPAASAVAVADDRAAAAVATDVGPEAETAEPATDEAATDEAATDEAVIAAQPRAAEQAPEPDRAVGDEAREARSPGRRRRPRDRAAHEQSTPTAPPPDPTPATSDAPGFLTLATTPWTRVQLGTRDLGTTPLIRLELPPGTHTLHLTNAEAGIDQTYRVTIRSGEAVTRRLGLQ